MSKRVLTRVIVLVVMLAVFAVTQHAEGAGKNQRVNNIILFIGDGMHLEHEIAASRYLYGMDSGLIFHRFPYQTDVTTWDVTTYNGYAGGNVYDPARIDPTIGYDPLLGGDRPHPYYRTGLEAYEYFLSPRRATDSASAATAWATGHKTDDGNIAWLPGDPEDGALKTIAELLKKKGKAIGVVSTVPFTHATPAAHVSHNKSRNNYYEIAEEILRRVRPDVVIGGGHPGWADRYMSQELYEDASSGNLPEYVFVERQSGVDGNESLALAAARAVRERKKLFGLFGGAGGNFEPPVPSDSPGSPALERGSIENPLLRDATLAALEVLSRNRKGFFLLVEQGDIDWANHANNFSWMVGTVWDLNEAVKGAVEFINRPGDKITWQNTMIIVTSDHANSYMRLNPEVRLGVGDLPRQECSSGCSYPDGEVTYSATSHTNELVRLYAAGAGISNLLKREGVWYPCTRLLDNTQLFDAMAEATRLRERSPLRLEATSMRSCDHPPLSFQ